MTLRRVLVGLVAGFTAYFLVRGLIWAAAVPNPPLQLVSVGLWLATTAFVLAHPGVRRSNRARRRGTPTRVPAWAAAVTVVATTAFVALTVMASGESMTDPLAASIFGSAGLVLTILTVRRRPGWAWGGTALLAAIGVAAMGAEHALARGLLGSILWVGLAQLMLWQLDRAYYDTTRLAELQQASSAWVATQEARRIERRRRVQFALLVAGPVLSRVIATGGGLTEQERMRALLAEGTLRDELRAARLLDDEVRLAIRAARERGATVSVTDDDALDDLDDERLARVRRELALALRGTEADRIIVRASTEPDVAVSIVGRQSASAGLSDEDALVLWQEIPR